MDLHNIRESYNFDSLEESKVNRDPMIQFNHWFTQYKALGIKDYNAMAISTIRENEPDSRIVLLKEITDKGLVFYSNYNSAKGKPLSENPKISVLFFWREQERQVRINGVVSKISKQESAAYFEKRPYLSQIGAAASNQSNPIESREALENKFEKCISFISNDISNNLKWKKKLENLRRPIIAIQWKGNEKFLDDQQRSIPFKFFSNLIKNKNYSFLSLQKDNFSKDIKSNKVAQKGSSHKKKVSEVN